MNTANGTPVAPAQLSRMSTDRAVKRGRLLSILDASGADALLLTSATALSWYLDGTRVHVSLAGDPVAALLVHRDGDELVAYSNEAPRLMAEELPADLNVHQLPWHGQLSDVSSWFELGPTAKIATEATLSTELRAARRSLLPRELRRYEALCTDAASVLTDVLSAATPQTTERQIAAELAAKLELLGADPLVLLCNGESRVGYRHPLPTAAPLGRRAMAVVCARRHGLIANVSRWVRFDASTAAERDAERRILDVEADTFAATIRGGALNEILASIGASYARHGFGADQWKLHHQGGPAGYAGRDPRATPATTDLVAHNQAFAWNPSAPGVKVEDTVLVSAAGIRPLSVDSRWPTVNVAGIQRPETLQL